MKELEIEQNKKSIEICQIIKLKSIVENDERKLKERASLLSSLLKILNEI